MIYLDYAAATPLDESVLKLMQPYFMREYFNPSADYIASRKVQQAMSDARAKVAHWLGAKPSEIIFTAGGTEANNLAVKGVMALYPKGKIIVSAIEHESVLAPAANYNCSIAPVSADGRLNLDALQSLIDDRTVLLSVMYANNEVGTIQPLRRIAVLVNRIRYERQQRGNKLPLMLHSDACQAGNYLDLHVSRLGVDLLTLNGGKIYGPKQSGALYVRAGTQLKPLIEGGGQEFGLRSGTENTAAAVGFAAALDMVQSERETESARLAKLRDRFKDFLLEINGTKVNGSSTYRLPNNLNVTLRKADNEALLIKLDQRGILAAAGSACSASNEASSHVLLALGLSDAAARSSLRFSLGRGTTAKEISQAAKVLRTLVG